MRKLKICAVINVESREVRNAPGHSRVKEYSLEEIIRLFPDQLNANHKYLLEKAKKSNPSKKIPIEEAKKLFPEVDFTEPDTRSILDIKR